MSYPEKEKICIKCGALNFYDKIKIDGKEFIQCKNCGHKVLYSQQKTDNNEVFTQIDFTEREKF